MTFKMTAAFTETRSMDDADINVQTGGGDLKLVCLLIRIIK